MTRGGLSISLGEWPERKRSAFEIASLLRKHCGGFLAVVPRLAKSAATLIALGAANIMLGEYGELGPLDVQVHDPEREERISGLDEVQALERLNAFALSAFDQAMVLLLMRSKKKIRTLLPHIIRLSTLLTAPMFANIDVVRFTQMSRLLKVGEAYAARLLVPKHPKEEANRIAEALVERYPGHGFAIDDIEAGELGLDLKKPTVDQMDIMDRMAGRLGRFTAVGRVFERQDA